MTDDKPTVGRITQLSASTEPPTIRGLKIIVTPPAVADNRQDEVIDLTAEDTEAQRKMDFRRGQLAELDADRDSGVLDVVTMETHLEVAGVALGLEQEVKRLKAENATLIRALKRIEQVRTLKSRFYDRYRRMRLAVKIAERTLAKIDGVSK